MGSYHQGNHSRSHRLGGNVGLNRLRSMVASCFYQNYREVRLLVIHCSATRYDRDFPVEALRASHKARRFADIGYHFYVTRDGEIHRCRPLNQIGAHAAGWNDQSVGICYEGGAGREPPTHRHPYLRPKMRPHGPAPPIEEGLSEG